MAGLASRRYSFRIKLAVAAGLVCLADLVAYGEWTGSVSGALSLAVVAALATLHPAAPRSRVSQWALVAAASLALLPIERPSPLGVCLFWLACMVVALAPRVAANDTLAWLWRFIVAGLRAFPAPVRDVLSARKAAHRGQPGRSGGLRRALGALVLPIAGGVVFILLFAIANPVIAQVLESLRFPEPDLLRLVFWTNAGLGFWLLLRPRGGVRPVWLNTATLPIRDLDLAGTTSASSIVLSLLLFNFIFALQNGLDIAYLWSGAALPAGMSFAEYAHRGAYPLIATALLAGAFVLVFLRPGSAVATAQPVRALVTLWVVQNIFLVASTALRTMDYVEVYSLTRLRIAALAWMALVAVGLVLICWRLLRAKSSGWLINANTLAAGVVLAACSVVDLGALAAAWNVRHAAELGTGGAKLDVCYLETLGPAALVPLADLEMEKLPPSVQARAAAVRARTYGSLSKSQAEWRSWSWRGHRRLTETQARLGLVSGDTGLPCDVQPSAITPAPAPAPPLAPLTPTAPAGS